MKTLNKAGVEALSKFINQYGTAGVQENMTHWLIVAEDAYDDEKPVLELGARYSNTGNPVTIALYDEYFE